MVLIHCKYKGEEQQFLYETTVEIGVKDLIKELVEVHNLRLRIQRIKSEGDDLATHGPCKPCLLYTSPSPRDLSTSRMPSSA